MHEDIGRRVNALQGLAFHSLKALLVWSDDFCVEQPQIDAQHELIFALACEASELSQDKDDGRLLAVFERFGEALKVHFCYEEGMLVEIGYPGLEGHRAQHRAMLAELDFLQQRLATGGFDWAFQEKALVVLNFMLGVTVGHILHSDAAYARFIQGLQKGDRPYPAASGP